MTQVAERFEKAERTLPGGNLPWLGRLRASAIARFEELGFPSQKNEDWRFTPITPLAEQDFALPDAEAEIKRDWAELALCRLDAYRLVFVDGRYCPDRSVPLPRGIIFGSLAGFLKAEPKTVESLFAGGAPVQAFAALNTAFFSDGAVIRLPKGTALDKPIHLLFIATAREKIMSHVRVLVRAESGSKAVIIEEYAASGDGIYFTNAVTDVSLGENAQLEHYKIQRESDKAFHVATLRARQERDSTLTAHSVSFGGALTRNDVLVTLEAEGADCTLNGLYIVGGSQHVDNHTVIDHSKPHGTSRELYKGVLDGSSRAVFNGTIQVRPDAQKTDARVYNKNLLLSEKGLVNTKPEFKISANDVQCKHGATIGQLNADALFYLRSRGLSREAARGLLVYAFASEMIGLMDLPPIKQALEAALHARLPEVE